MPRPEQLNPPPPREPAPANVWISEGTQRVLAPTQPNHPAFPPRLHIPDDSKHPRIDAPG